MISKRIYLSLLLIFLLAACTSNVEEEAPPAAEDGSTAVVEEAAATAVSTEAPKPTPEPTKEPTAVPEPAIELGETIRSEAGGFGFQTIPGYEIMNESGVVVLSIPDGSPEDDLAFLLAGAPTTPEDSVDSLLADFVADVLQSETFELSPTSPITVGGLDGLEATFTETVDDGLLEGQIIILSNASQSFIMFGGAKPSLWAEKGVPYFAAILDSVTLFEPTFEDVTTATIDEPAADAPTTTEQVAAIDGTDFACFTAQDQGVSCLDGAGNWHLFTEENSPLGGNWISAITACPDGRLWMAHFSGISIFDGSSWAELDDGWGNSSVDHIACDADSNVWISYYGGVSYFDGSTWTNHEASLLATGEYASDLVNNVAIAPDGTVWTSTSNSIASYDGIEWTVYQPEQGLNDVYYFDTVKLDSEGRPWLNQGDGLLTLVDGAWVEVNSSDYLVTQDILVDAENRVWVGTFNQGLYLYTEPTWTQQEAATSGLSSDKIKTMATDANGRLWVAIEWGLNVFDGSNWTSYHMHTAPLPDHEITGIAIVGGGPALPQPMETAVSTMMGEFNNGDASAANFDVVICVETFGSQFEGETPCSEQPLMFRATTDENGRFAFPDIPTGYYVLAFNDGNGWKELTDENGFLSKRIYIPSGEEWDLGTIRIESSE